MTDQERLALAYQIVDGQIAVDTDAFWSLPETDRQAVIALVLNEIAFRRAAKKRWSVSARRARRLLRSWLSMEQQRMLTSCGYFIQTGTLGGRYRLHPRTGNVEEIRRHGRRDFLTSITFCLHDADNQIPDADVTLAHVMLLRTDEDAFLTQANRHQRTRMLWDGEWRRRLNRARREREAC